MSSMMVSRYDIMRVTTGWEKRYFSELTWNEARNFTIQALISSQNQDLIFKMKGLLLVEKKIFPGFEI